MARVFDEYCGAWVARAGLTLADGGELPTLTGGFWYDDSARAWSKTAKDAFREAGGREASSSQASISAADPTATVFWQTRPHPARIRAVVGGRSELPFPEGRLNSVT